MPVHTCDDFGRTPLHDAFWTPLPNPDAVAAMLDVDPALIAVADKRGATPLGYARPEHGAFWVDWLDKNRARYWPAKGGEGEGEIVG